MSLSDFETKKEKSKEQQAFNNSKPQGPTSNNLITTINETDIESDPEIVNDITNYGTNVSNELYKILIMLLKVLQNQCQVTFLVE